MANEEVEGNEQALVPLNSSELAALIPANADVLNSPVHAGSAPPERRQGGSVPYIAFRGRKSEKNAESLDAAGIKVAKDGSGVFYLMDPPIPTKIDPFQFHLLQYGRMFTKQDDNGNVTDASFESDDSLFDDGFREAIFGVAAVVLPDGGYTAATLQLRGAQVKGLRDALSLLDSPSKMRGDAWKHTAAIKAPGLRFRVMMWSTLETPTGGGQKFNQGHGQVKPTPVDEVEKIEKFRTEQWPSIQAALALNNARLEKLRRLANKGATAATKADPIPF